jgi:Icc-related predicted phosphoesterase
MKVQVASDLHLERSTNFQCMLNNPIEPVGDVLVLAGDICNMGNQDLVSHFFDTVKEQFQKVIYIPGNHEYYGINMTEDNISFVEEDGSMVRLNNVVYAMGDVRFICTTLWSGVSQQTTHAINDYYVIKGFDKTMENIVHQRCKDFLIGELERPFEGKTVVVSHHLPLLDCIDEQYKGDSYNDAFASDQSRIIKNHDIDLWVHGHSHGPCDMEYEGTRIIRNPLGYCQGVSGYNYMENSKFNLSCVVEV